MRLSFGLASAPEVFQRAMSEVFDGLQGVWVYIGDILIQGTSRQENDEQLRSAVQAVHRAGMALNLGKCQFEIEKAVSLGDVLSKKRHKPDPSIVEAVLKLEKDLQAKKLFRAWWSL